MFWKIFSGIWLCSWKYHRKHIFYLLHTFSHIFSAVKQIYNIIPQYRNTKETKLRKKKIHQIRSYRNTKETKPKKKKFIRSRSRGEIEWHWSQSLLDRHGAIGIGVDLCLIGAGVDLRWCESALVWHGATRSVCGRWTGARSEDWSGLSLSLSPCESGNGLKWKFSLQTISGSN